MFVIEPTGYFIVFGDFEKQRVKMSALGLLNRGLEEHATDSALAKRRRDAERENLAFTRGGAAEHEADEPNCPPRDHTEPPGCSQHTRDQVALPGLIEAEQMKRGRVLGVDGERRRDPDLGSVFRRHAPTGEGATDAPMPGDFR